MVSTGAKVSEIFSPTDLQLAVKIVSSYRLCPRCLGRMFAHRGRGISNMDRGKAIAEKLGIEMVPETDCILCRGSFMDLSVFINECLRQLKGYEFNTYLVGTRIDHDILEIENDIIGGFGLEGIAESIKNEFNREIGKALKNSYHSQGINIQRDINNPDMIITVDITLAKVEIKPTPIFIFGRYLKLRPGIPQTKWPCRICRGHGCKRCNFTGKMYDKSVEELIAEPFMTALNASDHAFHGLGREDIDARMLGNGRPFVLELKMPMRRNIDLKYIEDRVNSTQDYVRVRLFGKCTRAMVRFIKALKVDKTYEVKIKFEDEVSYERVKEALNSIGGKIISQRTPTRVRHRRGDNVRKRMVRTIKIKEYSSTGAIITVKAESGLYIKELMHGDNGRTKPSLAELLGINVRVESLDVVAIHDDYVDYDVYMSG